MLKNGIVLSLLLFVCLVLFCCSSMEWKEWEENKDFYQFLFVPVENTFIDYYLITLMNHDHQTFHLLSKVRPLYEKPPFKKYEIVKSGFYYKINLSKIDSIIVLEPKLFISRSPSKFIITEEINNETIEIWSDDTLRVPAYTSENIFGLYVEILE